jgi:hypothetical protein
MRHNVIEKILPRMISEHWRRIGFDQRPDIAAVRALCREIDLLHPQIDDSGRRPDNVEYLGLFENHPAFFQKGPDT